MPSYAVPLSSAFFAFAIIAFIGTVPWTIYQYRKHGYFSFWRNLIFFSFIYYCLTAFFLVSLPLPKERNNTLEFKDHVFTQLKPFNMINNFQQVKGFNPSSPKTYLTLFKSFTFLEVFFNIALLFPLGVYLRFFFKKASKWYLALLLTFSMTLFFEVSQLTALFGYYAYPYRLFDVDDLLMNTLGGMIGFFTAPILLFLIPSREQIEQKDILYNHNKIASYGAQLIEIFVSMMIARFIGSLFSGLLFHGEHLFIFNTVSVFFFIVILPRIWKGQTLGGKLVKIKIMLPSSLPLLRLSHRFILIYTPSVLSQFSLIASTKEFTNPYALALQIGLFLLTFFVWGIFWLFILRDWFKKRGEVFFNRFSSIDFIRDTPNKKADH
ncbi:VanZ family protein [Vagococcus hydrophili]|uniref:VanZ family protein n=1 Tax=Vagococcus hydrophili TaxID=2714947 RepID=A0A6G8AV30_9ENTE|nr:VanZ family protein [Vagococcus hydrophili]QIL48795.1 VanZ family protein [Vagococcus hydrophili]